MRCLYVFAACGLLLAASCAEKPAGPASLPAPIQVPGDQVPTTFGGNDYFLYGWNEADGVEGILKELLDKGFLLRAAWVPDSRHPGLCSLMCPTSLLVTLAAPDPRLTELGFTQDSSHLFCCSPLWLKYVFDSARE